MNNTAANKNLMNMALMNGLIAMIANMAILITTYLMGASYYNSSQKWGFFLYLIPLGIVIFSAVQLRKNNGGYIAFNELFRYTFVMCVLMQTGYALLFYVLVKFVDPDYVNQIIEASKKQVEERMREKGIYSQDSFDQQMAFATKYIKFFFTFGGVALTWGIALIRDAILGLIVCAILKKDKPLSFDDISQTTPPVA